MGPLAGLRIVEFAGIGPAPMCCMLLADLGATVLCVDRPEPSGLGIPKPPQFDLLFRGRKRIALDLKSERGVARSLMLVERADALVEGFRPGVMERLGLGPAVCLARNPRLIYGRMTGWGQNGPLANTAGHDLNYIAVAGALHAFGRKGELPAPPVNLVGDFGGALYLALGIVAGILEARRSGEGQIVDAAMVETASHMMTSLYGMLAAGMWNLERGTNLIDSGAFFYDCFECSDGKLISVAAIEPKFFRKLLGVLEIDPESFPAQHDKERAAQARGRLADRFRTRTRDEWCAAFEGTDACVAPVLTMAEARHHPHMQARAAFLDIAGIVQPAPVPRFSRTVPDTPAPPDTGDSGLAEALAGWFSAEEIAAWMR
jgi:crotonobetainyl-CoA:carnitine CoA-transferase CaiB-like acyl-CoA transferase